MWAPLGVCRCHGHIDITYHYHHHYGPICLLGSKTDTKDCRYYSSTSGYSSTTCTAYGWPSAWTVVGYVGVWGWGLRVQVLAWDFVKVRGRALRVRLRHTAITSLLRATLRPAAPRMAGPLIWAVVGYATWQSQGPRLLSVLGASSAETWKAKESCSPDVSHTVNLCVSGSVLRQVTRRTVSRSMQARPCWARTSWTIATANLPTVPRPGSTR